MELIWEATFLDALVALGDRGRIEAEAPKWLSPGIYAEPFAIDLARVEPMVALPGDISRGSAGAPRSTSS